MSGGPLIRYRCVMLRRSGASEIRIVRATDEAAARAGLEEAGLNPVSVEPIGPSLFDALADRIASRDWRLPRHWPARPHAPALPPRGARIAIGLILATIPVTTAIGAWGLAGFDRWQAARIAKRERPAIAAYARIAATEQARGRIEAAMAPPPASALVDRLRATLPEEAGLSAMGLEDGVLTVEIETPDPDRLRSALAEDPLLSSLRETGQATTNAATLRVTLKGPV